MNKKNIISVFTLVVVVGIVAGLVAYFSVPKSKYSKDALDQFALCLASKKITMYGAVWCPHCQAQKALFGPSFEKVPYVECPDNQKLCLDKGVRGYPTWITADGTKYEGQQTLETLSQVTDCKLTGAI